MNDFYISMKKFSHYEDKAVDWFLKSYNYEYESDEWKICRLNNRVNRKKATFYLDQANKQLTNAQH